MAGRSADTLTQPPGGRAPGRRFAGPRALLRDRTAMLGAALLAAVFLMAILAPLLAPHDPSALDATRRLEPPSAEFPLGTDHLGRDVLSRLLYGARLSLGSTVVASLSVAAIGLLLGLLAGYLQGAVDTVISRLVDIVLAFPLLLLALVVTGMLGPSLPNVVIAVVLVAWAGYARIVRGVAMSERERPYVEAARALGASEARVLRRHILPNAVAPIVILTTLDMGTILLAISALSFLGLGVKPPTPEWGAMLAEARAYLRSAPMLMFFPGAAIFLSVLGFNLLGDGLRDVLDPRTRPQR